jgi:membrane protein DedA with SNARE-associated domain
VAVESARTAPTVSVRGVRAKRIAFFFVAAGLSNMPGWKVALYGGVSAAVWNGLLLLVGWALGSNLDRLAAFVRQYTWVALAAFALAIVIALWRTRRARTKV